MTDAEVTSLAQQIRLCYSTNHKQENPHQLYFTNFGGRTKNHSMGSENWKVKLEEQSYLDLFPKESLVYLTADSETVCEDLDRTKVYIIGGIVDHNRLKGITLKKAQDQGIATAQLPIGKFMAMSTRKVLTVNHVFEILVKYAQTNSWEQAFQSVIPKRKKGEVLPQKPDGSDGEHLTDPNNSSLSQEEGSEEDLSEPSIKDQ